MAGVSAMVPATMSGRSTESFAELLTSMLLMMLSVIRA